MDNSFSLTAICVELPGLDVMADSRSVAAPGSPPPAVKAANAVPHTPAL
ncbi:hypothetical protein [Nocardia cyriacigeorgica]|nr:hypothetical protein [Nocardia cyriacigeorgica]